MKFNAIALISALMMSASMQAMFMYQQPTVSAPCPNGFCCLKSQTEKDAQEAPKGNNSGQAAGQAVQGLASTTRWGVTAAWIICCPCMTYKCFTASCKNESQK